jgi:hypothetical protein
MITNRNWRALAVQGHPQCPKGFVYVGMGENISGGLGFGSVLRWNQNSHSGKLGTGSRRHYFCPLEQWEEVTKLKFKNLKTTKVKPVKVAKKTLEEIREELAAAHELSGRYISGINTPVEVITVRCSLTPVTSSCEVENFFRENGYVIELQCSGDHYVPYTGQSAVERIEVNGYTGEERCAYWKFGCAHIDKILLANARDFLRNNKEKGKGNRAAEYIKIGVGEFNLKTLEKMLK